MVERKLGPGLRVLIGLLGALAIGGGAAIGARQIRAASASWPHWPAALVAAFCGVVVLGGMQLLRGAMKGRIKVRDPRGWR